MIRLIERDNVAEFEAYCKGDPYGVRIVAAERTYGTSESFAQFWLQYDERGNITAAIGRLDNGMTVCAKGDYDTEEVDAFVETCVGKIGALRPARKGEVANGVVMRLDRSRMSLSGGETEINPPPEDIYTVIERCPGMGFDVPPFEMFYDDCKKRTKAGTEITALLRTSEVLPAACAALHVADNTGVVTMCATLPELRGKGYAADVVGALIEHCRDAEIYVMCLSSLVEFYEHLGFGPVGGFVY